MPINRDLSALPSATGPEGRAPDPSPRFVTALAQAWYDSQDRSDRERAVPGTRFRASWAGKCSRDLWWSLRDEPLSDPPTIADVWRMELGKLVHEGLDEAITAAFPGAEVEVKVDLRPTFDGSATVDVLLQTDSKLTLLELKTINGFGFKMAATSFKGPPEGPRDNAVIQAALAAEALGADELVVGYLSLENLSPSMAPTYGDGSDIGRFAAEWTYLPAEYLPIAAQERKRVEWVFDQDEVPDAFVYVDGRTVKLSPPGSGQWVVEAGGQITDTGKTWHCDYCWNRTKCRGLR